jgi:hypothetical protein
MPTAKEREADRIERFKTKKSKIELANFKSLTNLLKDKTLTTEQKRELVAERNPFIYALGIGGHRVSNKTVSQAKQA